MADSGAAGWSGMADSDFDGKPVAHSKLRHSAQRETLVLFRAACGVRGGAARGSYLYLGWGRFQRYGTASFLVPHETAV